jgi:hypothetical protein
MRLVSAFTLALSLSAALAPAARAVESSRIEIEFTRCLAIDVAGILTPGELEAWARRLSLGLGSRSSESVALALLFPELRPGKAGVEVAELMAAMRDQSLGSRIKGLSSLLGLVENEEVLAALAARYRSSPVEDLRQADWPSVREKLLKLMDTEDGLPPSPWDIVEFEHKLSARLGDARKRRIASLPRSAHDYRSRMTERFVGGEPGKRTWNAALGRPPGMGNERPAHVLAAGDRVVLGGRFGTVTIGKELGMGGEHVIYEALPDGAKSPIVLKIRAWETGDRVAETRMLRRRKFPVLGLEEVQPQYFVAERYRETGRDVLLAAIRGAPNPARVNAIIAFYRSYLTDQTIMVTDIKPLNLGFTAGGKLRLTDWQYVLEKPAPKTLFSVPEARAILLSDEIARSFEGILRQGDRSGAIRLLKQLIDGIGLTAPAGIENRSLELLRRLEAQPAPAR